MKRKNVYIDELQDDKLDSLSDITGTLKSKLIRLAIDEYISKYGNEISEFMAGLDLDESEGEVIDPNIADNKIIQKHLTDPIHFIENALNIFGDDVTPTTKLREYQRTIINRYETHNRLVIKKIRQSGITQITGAYLIHNAITSNNQAIAIFTPTMDQGRYIINNLYKMLSNLPPAYENIGLTYTGNKHEIRFSNGSVIRSHITNGNNIRGGNRYDLIYMDEIAFTKPHIFDEFMVILSAMIDYDTKIIIASTPNGINHFYTLWVNALLPTTPYKAISIHWSVVPGRGVAWLQEQEQILGKSRSKQEYEGAFIIADEYEGVELLVDDKYRNKANAPLMVVDVIKFQKGNWD